jgi:hypothetical protein
LPFLTQLKVRDRAIREAINRETYKCSVLAVNHLLAVVHDWVRAARFSNRSDRSSRTDTCTFTDTATCEHLATIRASETYSA